MHGPLNIFQMYFDMEQTRQITYWSCLEYATEVEMNFPNVSNQIPEAPAIYFLNVRSVILYGSCDGETESFNLLEALRGKAVK